MKIKSIYTGLVVVLALVAVWRAEAQSFERYFEDRTLRIDYSFSGDRRAVGVSVDELHSLPTWAGRRQHLDSLALEGNGRITMSDSISGQVIYRTSFSSLFQEWLSTEEAKERSRSFENVFLLPMPRRTALVKIELDNIERKKLVEHSFYLRPSDILIRQRDAEPSTQHHYLHRSRSPQEAIDIAILAEGYTEAEMGKFVEKAQRVSEEILSYEPFKSYREHINILAVCSPSKDSGVSVPRQGEWRRTAFSSHFDTFYSERYLTTSRVKSVHEALVNIPYEHIIILANTEVYGGGGIYNSYTLSSVHPQTYLPVVVHEFGHSFGGLADEYFYEGDTMSDSYSLDLEPWEQNITSLKDFWGKKWSSLLPKHLPCCPTPQQEKGTYPIALYEGAGYTSKGLYRSSWDCRMRTNSYPTFCPACHKALDELIRYYLPAPAQPRKKAKR